MALTVTRTKNEIFILTMLEMFWDVIAEDGQEIKDAFIDPDQYWLAIEDKENILGIFCMIPVGAAELDCHAHVFKNHRDKSFDIGVEVIKWALNNTPENFQKFSTKTPECYPNVYRYTKKIGFKDEGFSRASCLKKGELYGQYLVGATRQELKEFIEGLK